jgi:hypothetical protein
MNSLGPIEREFRRFCLMCFGDVSKAQYTDMRRCFFAGAAALLEIQMKGLSPGDEPTEEDLKMMREVNTEILEFGDRVKSGKA